MYKNFISRACNTFVNSMIQIDKKILAEEHRTSLQIDATFLLTLLDILMTNHS